MNTRSAVNHTRCVLGAAVVCMLAVGNVAARDDLNGRLRRIEVQK